MLKKSYDIAYLVEELLDYAKIHLSMREEDRIYLRNILLNSLKVAAPSDKKPSEISIAQMITPDRILSEIVSYAVDMELTTEEEKSLYGTFIMGIITPHPSSVIDKFKNLYDTDGVQAACDFLYNLSIKNNYIALTDIMKNIKWEAKTKKANLEITINLSKPEKDNKEIARLKAMPQSSYPKCLLCIDNVGYAGRLNHPARQTLRTVPVTLDNENWNMQYSPYVYYDEHCIVFSSVHTPMVLNHSTYRKLADFVTVFPNYFLGSNACLPIVGGSILTHEHYQGGRHLMPMHKANILKTFAHSPKSDVTISILDWFNSVVHLESENKDSLVEVATMVHDRWMDYTDESVDIIAKTTDQHNAITPIMRYADGKYILDMILRNNRTSDEHPDGIYHAHKQYHNIKKEGIGIIEVMGLFILPARLKTEIEGIKQYVTGVKKFTPKVIADETNPLRHHFGMIKDIIKQYSNELSNEDADIVIRDYINSTCEKILGCTAVFKMDSDKGLEAFDRFIETI